MMRSRLPRILLTCLVFATVSAAWAQPYRHGRGDGAFQVRLGGFFPNGGGEFWSVTEEVFTTDADDFNDAILGVTFVTSLSNYAEMGVNLDYYSAETTSAVRGFTDQDGFPILHDARLRILPLMVDVRFLPAGRYALRGRHGQRLVRRPAVYVGGGLGMNFWAYEEVGEFVNFFDNPPSIFFDRFNDDGVAFAAHVLAGVEIPMGPGWNLMLEGRYLWSDDELGDDFAGLGALEMDGGSVYLGASFSF